MAVKTIGCIGCGNMGGGVLRGLLNAPGIDLAGHDHTREKGLAIRNGERGVAWAETPAELARRSDIVILGVKPHQMEEMLRTIEPELDGSKVVVSLAAAFPLEKIVAAAKGACPCVRVMPSLPVTVQRGVFALCFDDPALKEDQKQELLALFEGMGKAVVLPEAQFAAFSSLVGCGPAFACLFMEGLLNAAITMGFKAPQAKELIAAMVEGTGRLALLDTASLADIRVRVCSPAGTTIRGVNHMERCGVAGHVADAVLEALRRDQEMAGK